MIPLSLSVQLEKDEDFRSKVSLALNIIAHEVLAEPPNTPEHIVRINHANMVIQLPRARMEDASSAVAASPIIQNSNAKTVADITDDQIMDASRTIWNSMIGLQPTSHGVNIA